MTTGYMVKELGNRIVQAVELSSGAYLEDGCGEEILAAYQNGKAEQYLNEQQEAMPPSLKQEMRNIRPEWYRKTVHSRPGDSFAEYGYVLRGDQLRLYYRGRLLFTADQDTVERWLYVARNLHRFENTYLYSEDKLNMEYEKTGMMFSKLGAQIQEGCSIEDLEKELRPKDFIPMTLDDYHCVDVWHRPEAPAYIKRLKVQEQIVEFIVNKPYGKWGVCLQLPYIRVPILGDYRSEKAAVEAIRQLARKHPDELARFAQISRYVKKSMKALQDGADFDWEKQQKTLESMYEEAPWFGANHFGIQDILHELMGIWRRRQEKVNGEDA